MYLEGIGVLDKLGTDTRAHRQTDAGTKMLVAKAIKEIVVSWRENAQHLTEGIFDGSDSSNLKLTMMMDGGAMLTEGALEGIDQISMTTALKRTLHAQMIPITWGVSAENMYPVIIRVSPWPPPFPHLPSLY